MRRPAHRARRLLPPLTALLLLILLVALGAWLYSRFETPDPHQEHADTYPPAGGQRSVQSGESALIV